MANSLLKQILDLESKSVEDLKKMYTEMYYKEPQLSSKKQLIRKIAYRLQDMEYGFLQGENDRKLENLTAELGNGRCLVAKKHFPPMRGVKFKRAYNGIDYEVEAVENGFLFDGMVYKSLSAIARKITGTHWNGLRFFSVAQKSPSARMTNVKTDRAELGAIKQWS